METIKYEAVFGDQSLFDNAIGDSVAAINHGDVVFCFNSYNAFLIEVMKCNDLPLSYIPEFAMRRIIKTPVWTKADKDAGRLPEVGSKVEYVLNNEFNIIAPADEFENRDILQILAHVQSESGCMCVAVYNERAHTTTQLVIECIKPIETPEERAQRLRDEWCFEVRNMSKGELYDALLSGELQSPKDLK